MKNVLFQVKYDIINGIVHQWKKFAVLAVVYAVIIAEFLARYKIKNLGEMYTTADIILWLFKGMDWITDTQRNIEIPTAYMLPNILIAFIIGNYPFKDINGYGGMVLIRARKKSVWWVGKCVWAVFTALVSYGIMFVEVLSVSAVGGEVTFRVGKQMCSKICGYNRMYIENNTNLTKLAICMVLVGLLTTIAVNLVQMCMSQIAGPIVGYIVVVTVLVMSVFVRSFLVIGNGFMAMRNSLYSPEGGDIRFVIIADVVLIVVSVAVGYISFKRMDIMKKGDWRM
ncbi:MAG: DUF2705 family protein [Lachnospira sp.]